MYVFKVTTIVIITVVMVGVISTAAYFFGSSNTTNPEAKPLAITCTIALATMTGIFAVCHFHSRSQPR